jgi:hypothetical protein
MLYTPLHDAIKINLQLYVMYIYHNNIVINI